MHFPPKDCAIKYPEIPNPIVELHLKALAQQSRLTKETTIVTLKNRLCIQSSVPDLTLMKLVWLHVGSSL